MSVLYLIRGGKISGAGGRVQRPSAPHHHPVIRGNAAMADSNSTRRLCFVCDGPMPLRTSKGRQPVCCSSECRLGYQRAYYEKHRNQWAEKGRQRRASGAARAAWNRWHAKNQELERARNRERMRNKRTDPEVKQRDREDGRRRYAQQRKRLQERARSPEIRAYMRAYIRTPKGRIASLRSSQTHRARRAKAYVEHVDPAVVFASADGICGICDLLIARGEKWHVDHIVPLAKGGKHSYANTQPAHAFCNISKGAKLIRRAG